MGGRGSQVDRRAAIHPLVLEGKGAEMNHLRIRTEYSFRGVFGPIAEVLAAASTPAVAITDSGTWGHAPFYKAARKAGIKPILGVEILVVDNAKQAGKERTKQNGTTMAFLARNEQGLQEIYRLTTLSHQQFYYVPRIDYNDVNAVSNNIYIISGTNPDLERLRNRGNVFLELSPGNPAWNRRAAGLGKWKRVVCCDNYYPEAKDVDAYEVLAGRDRRSRTTPIHILDEWELRLAIPEAKDVDFEMTDKLAADCNVELPKAMMVRPERPATLYNLCVKGAAQRGVNLKDATYKARLKRELDMIAEKQFEDYFYVIMDMVQEAKKIMFVGPARGSSAGSLVCYLLGITDVDPIVHDLMFERFIDVTRADLPDVDIDFPDTKRDLVFEQLAAKYGPERVGRLGTIMRLKAKSTLDLVGMAQKIPAWELKDLKNSIIERSGGDARAAFCIADTFESLDLGKQMLAKYPGLAIASRLEAHANTSGTHAAGVIVSELPLVGYCSYDKSGSVQIDKRDAEELDMLKIDVLGLRTLSVLEDCLEQIGKSKEWLNDYPLDDSAAFEIMNEEKFSGIFQFEGYALQSLTRQMKIRDFNDIVAITSLARPGPLHCGAAGEFVARRTGNAPVVHMHPLVEPLTRDTYGTVIYQEQVMAIGRVIGQLSWEDVSALRKAMSKSLGDEFFNQYWEKFRAGARAQKIPEAEARRIWDKICTFGSWAFNKSHAVSYGLISYWCAMLKAHYPLEFAAAGLRNATDKEKAVKILRDLVSEGYEYKAVDPKRSRVNWSVVDGMLLGGLTNIIGVGEKKAADIIERRDSGRGLQPGQIKLLTSPVTPFDDIFEAERRFGDMYRNPTKYKVESGGIARVADINDPGEYVFIAKIAQINRRDVNEADALARRGGRRINVNNLFLLLTLEDDTGSIKAKISTRDYKRLGKPIVETMKVGDWVLWKGKIKDAEWRMVHLSKYRSLENE